MRAVLLCLRGPRLLCEACGVWAAVQKAGRRPDGSSFYAVSNLCEICQCNRRHAVTP